MDAHQTNATFDNSRGTNFPHAKVGCDATIKTYRSNSLLRHIKHLSHGYSFEKRKSVNFFYIGYTV